MPKNENKHKSYPFILIFAVLCTSLGIAFIYRYSISAKTADSGYQGEKNLVSAENAPIAENNPSINSENSQNGDVSGNETANPDVASVSSGYSCPVHKNISVTYFWVGEDGSDDNKHISNSPSAWDDTWSKHFGGVDDPNRRNGFFPATFVPKENPFYAALPYNDFDKDGKIKKEIFTLAPWAKDISISGKLVSLCKNQWIKITKGDKTAYAQWEDVGPFKEDDKDYVFGSANPSSKTNQHAGIDVAPAVRDYLGLSDVDTVDWQFVDPASVPDGPWKKIITSSQIFWE